MSLRARLVLGLLALAAVGLVALASVTYLEQRSFLLQRVDEQARDARLPLEHALQDGAMGSPRPGRPGGGGPGGPVNLPAGTYGELRDASGGVVSHVVASYGQDDPAPPALPKRMEAGEVYTVDAKGGSDLRYRAVASPAFAGGESIVAAVPLSEVDQTLDRLALVEAFVILGVLLALGALAWVTVRIGLRPLERMATTAGAIAAGDLGRRVEPATPRTEVGRLGLALNEMLARLERAFAERRASEERLRRFLADASHELRTPLASIRGYAELFRTGPARDEANTEKAMQRIEDEAARMGVLVEDLLTLARLEEVRDRVRSPVDLGAIARDAVDDARAVAPDRAISVEAAPGRVAGDADQLRQVVANLMRNALIHTPAGTPVEVAVESAEADLVLTVRDHGPGLPPGSEETLFERFWRSEGGRRRGHGGAGLGLAIVAGIVEAHGGRVEAANAPGGGAIFTVRLPAAVRRAGEPASA